MRQLNRGMARGTGLFTALTTAAGSMALRPCNAVAIVSRGNAAP